MTETAQPTAGTDLALRSQATPARANIDHDLTDSWVGVMRPIVGLAEHVAGTEFVPKAYRQNAPAVAAAILHGRELGLPPMTALALTDPIEGKPSMKAEGLRALVFAAGHELEVPTSTGAQCTMRGRRRGSQTWTEVTWTLEMARAAGLAGKNVWKSYPRAMLLARATAELCRAIFPDVIHGMGFAEELADATDEDGETPAGVQPDAPGTTVRRQPRKATAKTTSAPPAPSGEPSAPSTPPPPLAVEIPMPDAPAPSGPGAPPPAPGPEQGGDEPTLTDQDVVDQAAADAPERDRTAEVVPISGQKVTAAQLRRLGACWSKLGVGDEDRRAYTETLVGHDLEGGTTKSLTKAEASFILDGLTKIENLDQLDDAIARRLSGSDAGDES